MAPESILEQFRKFQHSVVLEASDHALSTLNAMVEAGTLDLSPDYQRRDRWSNDRQSALIESFILNVPVPPVYLSEGSRGQYDVIDGKQRLTAIRDFFLLKYPLKGLQRFPELNGRTFVELPSEIQNGFNFRPLRTVTLLRQSSADAKYEVFHRLNTGGQALNSQEIRNVLFRGEMNTTVYRLAENVFLRTQLKIRGPKSAAYMNMTDAEWVLRFFAVRQDWQDFSGDFRRAMDAFMKAHSSASPTKVMDLERIFARSIESCEAIFAANAFKRWDGTKWRDQAMAGVFDAQMIACSELSDQQVSEAIQHRSHVLRSLRQTFDSDAQFDTATRQSTNTPSRVRYRISTMIELLTSTP